MALAARGTVLLAFRGEFRGQYHMDQEQRNTMSRQEKAEELFCRGYNCAQAAALAFADLFPFSEEILLRMISSFGGGMARLREVCGAVSAVFLTAGLLYGYSDPEDDEGKAAHYARIQELAARFEEVYGTIICRELLGLNTRHDPPQPSRRTAEFYASRPCGKIIRTAVGILEDYIKEHPVPSLPE